MTHDGFGRSRLHLGSSHTNTITVIEGGLLEGAAALGTSAMMPKIVERYTPDVDESGAELGCAHGEAKIIEFESKIPCKGFKTSHLFPNETELQARGLQCPCSSIQGGHPLA